MKDRKLEPKDICGYLPYELQYGTYNDIETVSDVDFRLKKIAYTDGDLNQIWSCISHFKPLLIPMSAITQPMTVEGYNDGAEFIPLEVIGKLYNANGKMYENSEGVLEFGWSVCNGDDYSGYGLAWSEEDKAFFVYEDEFEYAMFIDNFMTIEVVNLLHQWHFDINDLIGQGLALNKLDYNKN